jgi:hypothetical protein
MIGKPFRRNGKSISAGKGIGSFNFISAQPPQNCPPIDTLISSDPWTDYVYDAVSIQWGLPMVYHVHADGSCGTYVENHQNYEYLPAGFCTVAPQIHYEYFDYGYSITSPITGETVNPWRYYGNFEDGTGINYEGGPVASQYTILSNEVPWVRDGMYPANNTNAHIAADGNGYYIMVQTSTGETNPPPCDPEGTQYNNSGSMAYVYVSELNNSYNMGNNWGRDVANGDCTTRYESGTDWYAYGSFIVNGNGYNVYSNGNGGYYTESDGTGGGGGGGGPNCPEYGTPTGQSRDTQVQVYAWEILSHLTVGTQHEIEIADGVCSNFYTYFNFPEYYPDGTEIYFQEQGWQNAVFKSNGTGGYRVDYVAPAGQMAGTQYNTDAYVMIMELGGLPVNVGYLTWQPMTDGHGGTYNQLVGSNYIPFGIPIYSTFEHGFYEEFASNGSGGYYQTAP